jgi:hypothetical protein
MGGVLVPRIMQITLAMLAPQGGSSGRAQLAMYKLETSLSLGDVGPDEYCRAVSAGGSPMPASALAEMIPQWAKAQPGMLALLKDLPTGSTLRLVSDYPRQWLDAILGLTGLSAYFTSAETVVLAEQRLANAHAAQVDFLIGAHIVAPGNSLWVDHSSLRTSLAIRRGVDANMFTTADQFRRDLRIRRLMS